MQRTIGKSRQDLIVLPRRSSRTKIGPRRAARIDDPTISQDDCGAEFENFAEAIRDDLRPVGPLETLLVDCAIAAAWRFQGRPKSCVPFKSRGEIAAAERSFRGYLGLLQRLRSQRLRDPEPTNCELPGEASWRDRLVMDPSVSEVSPIVRGTWITVQHVAALVLDGWSWKDILRTHPELTQDDLRACLSSAVEDAAD